MPKRTKRGGGRITREEIDFVIPCGKCWAPVTFRYRRGATVPAIRLRDVRCEKCEVRA